MSGRRKTTICSIFGQIEGVVADAMVSEGKANRIDADKIPVTVLYNSKGVRAHCALVLSPEAEQEFNRRVAALYK